MVIYDPGIARYATRLALFVINVIALILPLCRFRLSLLQAEVGRFSFVNNNEHRLPRTYALQLRFLSSIETKRGCRTIDEESYSLLTCRNHVLDLSLVEWYYLDTSRVSIGLHVFTVSSTRQLTSVEIQRTQNSFVNLPNNLLLAVNITIQLQPSISTVSSAQD
jgi:hypothetical protein